MGRVFFFTITINQIKKYYYVKDHLGNIRQTLNETGGIASAQDYYPYGEVLRGYNQSLVNDKYKFSEKERDIETNFDCFGFRYYDGQLGIWLQVDPMADKYPGWSSYNYCLNNPLRFIDPHGDTVTISHDEEEINYVNGELYWKDGSAYNGKALRTGFWSFGWLLGKYSGYVGDVRAALNSIESGGPAGAELVGTLVNSQEVSYIKYGERSQYDPNTNTTYWNPNEPYEVPMFIGLAHELGHNYDDVISNSFPYFEHIGVTPEGYHISKAELESCKWENKVRAEHGYGPREWYYNGSEKVGKVYP